VYWFTGTFNNKEEALKCEQDIINESIHLVYKQTTTCCNLFPGWGRP